MSIIEEIVKGVSRNNYIIKEDRREAIHYAIDIAEPEDVVVIAGKGHETGQEVAGVVHPFDDRQVVREGLAQLGFAAESRRPEPAEGPHQEVRR